MTRLSTFLTVALVVTVAGCGDDAAAPAPDPTAGELDHDGDGVFADVDCDDDDATVLGPTLWYPDVDGDGRGDAAFPVRACADGLGVAAAYVADDTDPEPLCATDDTDACGVCAGGDAAKDCLGVCFGPARPDACGVCEGPGPTTWWYADGDGDGLGDPLERALACAAPEGFVANADDPEPGCATNDTDDCGVCGGANGDVDCDGVCFGGAAVDGCGRCAGGGTGVVPAVDDTDDDGTPDLCDPDCLHERRFIVQWDHVVHFGNGDDGEYTFQLVLHENGDFIVQYGNIEPYGLTATVGMQDLGGTHAVEFGYQTLFPTSRPTVFARRGDDATFVADYSHPLVWLDIAAVGEPVEVEDDHFAVVPIGFEFPFYEGRYESLSVGDNGIVAFAPPYGGYENASLPASGLGAFIAPLWDDFAPQDGGTIWVYTAPPTCEADCNGVVGGFGVPGECGVCLTGLEEGPPYDCAGVCGGAAAIDGCGVCAGGDTGVEAKQRDCAGVCGGTAAYDACHVCVGGTTGLEASDPESCPQGIDLIVDEEHVADTVSLDHVTVSEGDCLIHEGCVGGAGDRKVIRFATTIANIGSEDLVLGHPGDGGPHWHFDECHSHYHFEAYAAYRIIDVAAEQMLDIGSKNGFCVLDTAVYDPFIAPDGCKGYSCDDQGITAGCSDTYNADLQCQWIDVTGLPDGLYELVIETNPEQEIPEVNYVNNAAHVRVQLEGETVTVIR